MWLQTRRYLRRGAVPCRNETSTPEAIQCGKITDNANTMQCEHTNPLALIEQLKKEIEALKRDNYRRAQFYQRSEKKYIQEMKLLKKRLAKSEFEYQNMEQRLLGMFTAGQIRKLKHKRV